MAVEDTPAQLGDDDHLVPEPLEEREVARPPHAEPEVGPRDDGLDAGRTQVALRELLGRQLLELGCEGGDEDVAHAGVAEELDPPFERRQQLDPVAESDPRDAGRT